MNAEDRARLENEASLHSNKALLENYATCVMKVDGEGARFTSGDVGWWVVKKQIIEAEIFKRMEFIEPKKKG